MDELMTIDEASKFLKMSKSFLYTLVSKRKISYFKLGKSVRFRKQDLINLLNKSYHPADSVWK